MNLVLGDFFGLGHSLSAFGYTLALILTWFVIIGAVAGFLINYSLLAVLAERRENQARIRAYDEAHKPTF
jgi:Trk-type K+ transport system membrane component